MAGAVERRPQMRIRRDFATKYRHYEVEVAVAEAATDPCSWVEAGVELVCHRDQGESLAQKGGEREGVAEERVLVLKAEAEAEAVCLH